MLVFVCLFALLLTGTRQALISPETQEEIMKCLRAEHKENYGADWASNASKSGGSLVSFRRKRALVEVEKLEKKASKARQTSMVFRGTCEEYFGFLGPSLKVLLDTRATNLTVGCSVNKHAVISCIYSYRLKSG